MFSVLLFRQIRVFVQHQVFLGLHVVLFDHNKVCRKGSKAFFVVRLFIVMTPLNVGFANSVLGGDGLVAGPGGLLAMFEFVFCQIGIFV